MKHLRFLCAASIMVWSSLAPGSPEARMQWLSLNDPTLGIDVFSALSVQQRKLIASGLSTFSHFEIQSRDQEGSTALLFVAECTLKYDLWEEKYELQQLAELSRPPQNLNDYGELCFRAQLSSRSSLARLLEPGSTLEIRLDIAQVSASFASDIRRWLIEQQSGVMRGLFAHMLGELRLSETVRLTLKVPPPPLAPLQPRKELVK